MIVCQYTDKPNDPLLAVSKDWHEQLAKKHGYEFVVFTKPLDGSRHPYWQKPLILRQLLRDGYADIVWLDTDALWLGDELNPVFEIIGVTECFHPESIHNHHNVGVLYCNSGMLGCIDEWIGEPDDGHPWGDNWAFKKLVDRGVILATTLDAQWNSIEWYPAYRSATPAKVVAWHGYSGDRAVEMQRYVDMYRGRHAIL